MRRSATALVTFASLLLATAARGQQPATKEAAGSAPPMVAISPAEPSVDCATAVGDPRCPSMQLTPPTLLRKPKTKSHWYGWQTLMTDGAALAMLIGALAAKNDRVGNTLAPLAGLTYVLGGPIVHWAHRHGGIGAASLGIRLGAPIGLGLLGFGIGTAIDGGKSRGLDSAALAGTVLGFLAGFPTAIALDAAVLAREDVEDDTPEVRDTQVKLQRPSFELYPDVQTSRTGAQVGVRGTF
jgi:hypothetical protein